MRGGQLRGHGVKALVRNGCMIACYIVRNAGCGVAIAGLGFTAKQGRYRGVAGLLGEARYRDEYAGGRLLGDSR